MLGCGRQGAAAPRAVMHRSGRDGAQRGQTLVMNGGRMRIDEARSGEVSRYGRGPAGATRTFRRRGALALAAALALLGACQTKEGRSADEGSSAGEKGEP